MLFFNKSYVIKWIWHRLKILIYSLDQNIFVSLNCNRSASHWSSKTETWLKSQSEKEANQKTLITSIETTETNSRHFFILLFHLNKTVGRFFPPDLIFFSGIFWNCSLIINLFFSKWEAMLKSENKINYKSKEVKSNFFGAK